MKSRIFVLTVLLITISLNSCKQKGKIPEMNIIFLHHSTGGIIWNGTKTSIVTKVATRISKRLAKIVSSKAEPN
jgi:hypothetical protein